MSNKNNSSYTDRMEFLIALMTKEYANAEEFGRKILEGEPENLEIADAVSLLRQKQIEIASEHDSSSDSSSMTDDSECEQSSNDNSDEPESDADEGSDSEVKIDAKRFCQTERTPVSECDFITQYLSRMTKKETSYFNFENKLHRVLLINPSKDLT